MNDRKVIFSLIAMGRITPAEAERLLAVSNDRSETVVAIAVCAAALLLTQMHGHGLASWISHFLRSLQPVVTTVLNNAHNVVAQLLGGIR